MKKGEPKDDLRLFDKMAKRFPRNVGAVGRIRLLQGRYLEALGRAREAERVYAEAVPEGIKCKAIGLDLLDNAARLMLKRNAMKDTVALHKDAYHKTKSLTNHAFVMYTSRFAVGLRQAKVNALARNQKAHDSILRRICSKLKGSSQERQQLFERLKGRTYDQVNTSRRPTGA
jgi:hypothetical protein